MSQVETITTLESHEGQAMDVNRRESIVARLVALGAWFYLCGAVAAWVLLGCLADRWWPATVLLYVPRWPGALPLVVLFPAVLALHRRSLPVVLASGLIVLGPVMGLRVPWQRLGQPEPSGAVVRVMSLNVGGGFDAESFSALVKQHSPDIIAFQEFGRTSAMASVLGAGWHIRSDWARMGFASRFPVRGKGVVARSPSGRFGAVAVRCDIETPHGAVHVLNVHPETPRDGLQAVIGLAWRGAHVLTANTQRRRGESEAAVALLDEVEGPVLVAGDFNMPVESAIYRRYWGGFTNAFSEAGFGFGYTYGRDRRISKWVRIDHILADENWRVRRCWVGPNVGSDHWPVLAELELRSSDDGGPRR